MINNIEDKNLDNRLWFSEEQNVYHNQLRIEPYDINGDWVPITDWISYDDLILFQEYVKKLFPDKRPSLAKHISLYRKFKKEHDITFELRTREEV